MKSKTMLIALAIVASTLMWAVPASCQLINFFNQSYGDTAGGRNDAQDGVGYSFISYMDQPNPLVITALGRAVCGGSMVGSHEISLWRDSDHVKLASVIVTANSAVDSMNYKYEMLAAPITLTYDGHYRIVSTESGVDYWANDQRLDNHKSWAEVSLEAVNTSGVPDTFPSYNGGGAYSGFAAVTFYTGSSVPEPTSAFMLITGIAGVAALRRRTR